MPPEAATTAPDTPTGKQDGTAEVERTFTQAEVDRMIGDRLKREGIAEAKQKAAQYDALQESSKSEIEKLAEQVASLTKAQQDADAKALRYRVAAQHQLSTEDADLFLTGADEETITAQAKRLADRGQTKPGSNYAPNEGKQPKQPADPLREFTRQLFAADEI